MYGEKTTLSNLYHLHCSIANLRVLYEYVLIYLLIYATVP